MELYNLYAGLSGGFGGYQYHCTEVYDSLKMKNPEEVEIHICGFCTDICVMANAVMLRAALPNTRIIVHSSACAGVTPESHEAALTIFKAQQIDVED